MRQEIGYRCESVHREGKRSWRCTRTVGHEGEHHHTSAGRRWPLTTATIEAPEEERPMTVAVMSIPEALQHLRDAVARREAAEAEYNRTLEEFRKAAVDAKVAGARVVSIAEAAGISRQRAALLLKGIKAIDG